MTTGAPDPQALLHGTDWASLETACGAGDFLPAVLSRLLDPDPVVQQAALDDLEPVRHQNSLYAATVPVARYIAAILTHPATDTTRPGSDNDGSRARPTRAALLEWLGSLARDADDECVAIIERSGWSIDDAPHMSAFRALRPVFYNAIAPFLNHEDAAVRDAALVAAISLAEHPELTHHCDELARLARRLLATSTNHHHRACALAALTAWGQNTSSLETADDIAARTAPGPWHSGLDPWRGGQSDAPPF